MIIGICGATASGKSTFTAQVYAKVDARYVAIMAHDAYYHNAEDLPPSLQGANNYDHPDSLDNTLFVAHLRALRNGERVQCPVYDYSAHRRKPETCPVEAKPVIIVEGILLLAIPEIREELDIKVFIDTAADLRFLRRLQRDLAERGRSPDSVISQYLESVRPLHTQFVEPSRQHADIIIPGESHNLVAAELIANKINSMASDYKKHKLPK